MELHLDWLLLALPLAFLFGWLTSRLDLRQLKRDDVASPQAYFKGLNLLLNEQHDQAIDAFIEAVQHDPNTTDLYFALGNLFRRRGDYERAIRVHQHLLARADLRRDERERAQNDLAHDFMKAGLFDRAEQAFHALEGTAFWTDARLALLSLHERSRNWRPAIEIARQLQAAGAGSFVQRIAHHWCELAQEADIRGQDEEAQEALRRAHEAAPQAARPLVMMGQRALRQGHALDALRDWDELMAVQPQAFGLIALDYARAAQACSEHRPVQETLRKLETLYEQVPHADILLARNALQPDADLRRLALMAHMERQPSLSVAQGLIRERLLTHTPLGEEDVQRMQQAMAVAARPLLRYRCAACGFESQHYFWQCPGCQSWDSFPTRRLEEL